MVSFTFITSLLAGASLITAMPSPAGEAKKRPDCQKVDVFFTGLPPYHPLVISQGYDPKMVEQALAQDTAAIRKAGYNLRVVLIGPEQPLSKVGDEMRAHNWENTGVGFGVRGSRLQNLTTHFTDLISLFREKAPKSQIVFNYSPNSTLWALQYYNPLSSDCANKPGADLGYITICDICSSPNKTTTAS